MNKTKTIFCDIDGTLWEHVGNSQKQALRSQYKILPNTIEAITQWDRLGYTIILTTGRKESLREKTKEHLVKLGIVYDKLIMGIGGGDRIIINDKKPSSTKNTCYAINVIRNKGIPYYDFTSKFVIIPPHQPKEINKPWGKEELIEYNNNYVVKKLFMKKGECCSVQYHELKKETIYILKGKIKLYIGNDIDNLEQKEMLPGDSITITPYLIHRMEGMENSEYLECSTPELWDVIRLKDKYNRNNIVEKNIGKEMDYYEIVKKLYLNNWWKSGVRIEKDLKEREHQIGRFKIMEKIFFNIKKENIKGDLLELGVWKGQGLIFQNYLRNKYLSKDVKLIGIDGFTGLPYEEDGWEKNAFNDSNENIVKQNIKKLFLESEINNIKIIKGYFKDEHIKEYIKTIDNLSFIYFDADTKTSTHEALELVKHFIIKQEKTFIGFDDWQCFKYALSPSFAQFIHKLGNFSFKNIGNTEVTIFFEITNNNF